MKKCKNTVSGKHLWIALEVSRSFSGTVGSDIIYVLKCTPCDLVDDRNKTSMSTLAGIQEENVIRALLEMQKESERNNK